MPPREKQILKHIDIDNDGEDEILWVTPFQKANSPVPVTLFATESNQTTSSGILISMFKKNEDGEYVKVLQEIANFNKNDIHKMSFVVPEQQGDYVFFKILDLRKPLEVIQQSNGQTIRLWEQKSSCLKKLTSCLIAFRL